MHVAANHVVEAVLIAMISGTKHHLAAQKTVQEGELLRIVSDVYWACAKIDPQFMKKPKQFDKDSISWHDLVKGITVGNERVVFDGM